MASLRQPADAKLQRPCSQFSTMPKNSRPKTIAINPYATSFTRPKVNPLVSLSPKGKELGLGKSYSHRKTSWSPKSQTAGGIARPYASSIIIPPSSHLNRKSPSISPQRRDNSDIKSAMMQKHISPKLSQKTSRENSCHSVDKQQPGFLFGPASADQ